VLGAKFIYNVEMDTSLGKIGDIASRYVFIYWFGRESLTF
jgi:hypothetical protein